MAQDERAKRWEDENEAQSLNITDQDEHDACRGEYPLVAEDQENATPAPTIEHHIEP